MTKIEGEWRYFDDKLGMLYPWYTSPCLEYIDKLVLSRKRIFEYGAGASTKWFREKGAIVWGVDNNPEYITEGIQLQTFYPDYCSSILEHFIPFDIVVIDGEWRDECTSYALDSLYPGGMLIIDNYKQPSVPFLWTKTEKLIEDLDVKYFKEPEHPDWMTIIVTK